MDTTLLVILIVVGAVLLALGIVALVLFILVKASRWRQLVARYATADPPTGQIFRHETVKIGAVVYKRCVTVGIADRGLYLAIGRKTVLIPWSECKEIGQTVLHWKRVPTLTIGAPSVATIIVQNDLFAAMQAKLPVVAVAAAKT